MTYQRSGEQAGWLRAKGSAWRVPWLRERGVGGLFGWDSSPRGAADLGESTK